MRRQRREESLRRSCERSSGVQSRGRRISLDLLDNVRIGLEWFWMHPVKECQ